MCHINSTLKEIVFTLEWGPDCCRQVSEFHRFAHLAKFHQLWRCFNYRGRPSRNVMSGYRYQGTLVLWPANQDKVLSFQISRFCAGRAAEQPRMQQQKTSHKQFSSHLTAGFKFQLSLSSFGQPTLAYLLLGGRNNTRQGQKLTPRPTIASDWNCFNRRMMQFKQLFPFPHCHIYA